MASVRIGVMALFACSAFTATAQPSPNWVLVWSDDFNGPIGASPDPRNWAYETGNGGPENPGWGNGELQTYKADAANAALDGQGNLVIRARLEGTAYTSARIKTQGLHEFTFGRIEARIKIPYAQGIWPAFWMLGSNSATAAGWPERGEIDVMENFGKENNDASRIHSAIHGPGYSAGDAITGLRALPAGMQIAADFHVFRIDWAKDSIEFFLDGNSYLKVTAPLSGGRRWVFNDHAFFLILNLAVGGSPAPVGNPDATTVFPQQMLVDYVHVYRDMGPVGEPPNLKISVQ